MTGKSGNTVSYSADELAAKRAAGEGQTKHAMSHDEAMQRRADDPDAPHTYGDWDKTITIGIPEPKKQLTLRLDAEVVNWFKAQGKGYQTMMNAVLKGYVNHQSQHNRKS
jgi:uncharacterized protein (DUF4415 family)